MGADLKSCSNEQVTLNVVVAEVPIVCSLHIGKAFKARFHFALDTVADGRQAAL